MSSPELSSIDDLLQYQGWVKSLALSLARDEMTADDLAQQAWVAYLNNPPDSNYAATSWFRSVVRRLWSRRNREEGRRQKRERAAAPVDGVLSPDQLLEQADLHQKVAVAVAHLPELYRTVVVLRYFQDVDTPGIARELGIPVSTVRTRLARGKDHLRAALDKDYGERSSWQLIALPVTGVAGAEGGLDLVQDPATSPADLESTSALIVKSAAVVAVAVASVGGLMMGIASYKQPAAEPAVVASAERSSKGDEGQLVLAEHADNNAELRKQVTKRRQEVDALRARVAELRERVHGADRALPSPFRSESVLVEGTDWTQLAIAIREMSRLRESISVAREQNGARDKQTERQFAKSKLIVDRFALFTWKDAFHSHVPNNANAGLTHPFCVASVVAALLAEANLPLSDDQSVQVQEALRGAEAALDRLLAEKPEDSSLLELVLDEVRFKDDFLGIVEEVLSDEQLAVLFPHEHRDIVDYDILTPALSFVNVATPVTVESLDEAASLGVEHVAEFYAISESTLNANSDLFHAWASEAAMVAASEGSATTIRGTPLCHALEAGDSYRKLLQQLRTRLAPGERKAFDESTATTCVFLVLSMTTPNREK